MRLSSIFTKTTKEAPKDELSFNARILIQAGFIDKLAPGIYSYLPLGIRVLRKVENIIRDEMDKIGGQELLMPALIPRSNWDVTDRWNSFDALFKLAGHDNKAYGLGASHEEVVTPLVQQHSISYRDLPQYVYQVQTKFRNEKRAKAGVLRGREFIMKDMYSFHTDEADLNTFYKDIQKSYFNIFERCGLLDRTYLTYAAGGDFAKYSHEFQTVNEAGEDEIFICEECNIAINEEIIKDLDHQCPNCKSKKLNKEKSIEVGNIFKLKDRFTTAFKYTFSAEDGKQQPAIMGCYGIGITRLIGTMAEVLHDDKGLIWPKEVAPFTVHLMSLNSKDIEENNKIKLTSEKLYKELKASKIDVLFDDRDDASTGEKFADADLIGCPLRIVVSERTLSNDSVEVKKRDEDEKELVKIKNILGSV